MALLTVLRTSSSSSGVRERSVELSASAGQNACGEIAARSAIAADAVADLDKSMRRDVVGDSTSPCELAASHCAAPRHTAPRVPVRTANPLREVGERFRCAADAFLPPRISEDKKRQPPRASPPQERMTDVMPNQTNSNSMSNAKGRGIIKVSIEEEENATKLLIRSRNRIHLTVPHNR